MRFLFPGLIACLFAVTAAQADQFTASQRAEIVAIIRDAMKQDPSILRDAAATLQADDAEREKAATRAALAAAKDTLVTRNDPVAGNPHGDVTIVEFFDVRCPYCKKLEPEMAAFLAADPNVRLVYKDLPILGPPSVLGSKALLAARHQGAYDKLRTAIMGLPPDLTWTSIEAAAKKLGLDIARLRQDMDDPSVQAQIDANLQLAHQLNVEGTPALVIGTALLPGALAASELKKRVAEARIAAK